MVNCAVVGCTNNSSRNNRVAYHKLPSEAKNPDLRHAWLERIAREDPDLRQTFILRKNCYVCSEHFEEDDYEFSVTFLLAHLPNQRTNRILKKSAVPSRNLILKSKRKPRAKKLDPQISGIAIGPPDQFFATDFADSAEANVNQYAEHWKTEPGLGNSGFNKEPISGEEYGRHKLNPRTDRPNKRPKKRKIFQNSDRSLQQVQGNTRAFDINAVSDDENSFKHPTPMMTSYFGCDLLKCDREELEEPPDDYVPPLPLCKITEDAGTQCEMGNETNENTLMTSQLSPEAENWPAKRPKIRAKKLLATFGNLKKNMPRSISPSDFIVCLVDGGVQCEIGKEIYKTALRS